MAGEIPADVVHEGDAVSRSATSTRRPRPTCWWSRGPTTPTSAALAAADPASLAELVLVGRQVATAEGHDDYRLVFNTGAEAGQSVFHVHGHVLAGRPLSWPPG